MSRVYFCDSDPLILCFPRTLVLQFLQENRNFRSLVLLMVTNCDHKLCLKEIKFLLLLIFFPESTVK